VESDVARILMLTARFPFPLDDGWKIRTASLLRGLAGAGHEVHLLSFVSSGEDTGTAAGEPISELVTVPRAKAYAVTDLLGGLFLGTPFTVLNYRDPAFARAYADLLSRNRYDVVQVEDVVMAQYAAGREIPVRVLDMHNVESDLLRRFADETANPLQKLYARLTASKLARYEIATANRFEAVLTCSTDDRDRLRSFGATRPIRVTPNGVRTSFYDEVAASPPGEEDAIAFVASMDYHANISGVAHFVRHILPLILRERPSLRFYVVGKNPPPPIRALASPNVVVTGAVDDVRPYLRSASVIVVPLLVGGGTRLKILEAMASGRPVVSTRLGAEGIVAGDGQLVLADAPADFAAAVLSLLADPVERARIGTAARAYVARTYDWSVVTAGLNDFLEDLLAGEVAAT